MSYPGREPEVKQMKSFLCVAVRNTHCWRRSGAHWSNQKELLAVDSRIQPITPSQPDTKIEANRCRPRGTRAAWSRGGSGDPSDDGFINVRSRFLFSLVFHNFEEVVIAEYFSTNAKSNVPREGCPAEGAFTSCESDGHWSLIVSIILPVYPWWNPSTCGRVSRRTDCSSPLKLPSWISGRRWDVWLVAQRSWWRRWEEDFN